MTIATRTAHELANPALSAEKISAIAQAIHSHIINNGEISNGEHMGSHEGPLSKELIWNFLQARLPHLSEHLYEEITRRVLALATGLGPLQTFMEDELITEIMVNGPGMVLIERAGQIHPTDVSVDATTIQHIIERIIAPLGLHIDRRQPFGDARLADGTRVNIIIPPLAIDGPYITIRRFGARRFPLEAFSDANTAQVLRQLVLDKANIVVSGGTGAGKTSLLNALASAIPAGERVVTIEDAAELQLANQHVVRLETRPSNPDGIGAIDARLLLRNALRMRPNRIIIGEVRGSEVFEMLQAMNIGHEGSLSTCHANSVADTIHRLEMMALLYNPGIPLEAIRRQILSCLDVVVHMRRSANGERKITEVAKLSELGET